ncbi:hypothetical protein PSFL107428_14755 [Pseudoalteromonas maricaloris]
MLLSQGYVFVAATLRRDALVAILLSRDKPAATKICGNHTAISLPLLNLYTLLINKHYIETFCYKFDFIHCLFSVLKVSYFQLITGGWNYRFSVIN